ncbi:MAG: hypothetical protein JSW52_10590 [Candidatus Coatesbacteria bacterium]|nr:MAG: hypothetical protein JSW52_10590 [Candidatus Coatesbacteria bacterium]
MNGLFQKAGSKGKSIHALTAAFEQDGFEVVKVVTTPNGKRHGICAEHKTAKNSITGKPKKAYYVEGKPAEMGYLIGLMAPEDVERMAEDYTENIAFSFFQVDLDDSIKKPLGDLFAEIATNFTYRRYLEHPRDIPRPLLDEMQGVVKGCQAVNPNTKVTFKKLLCLNAGIDTLMSVLYPTGGFKRALEDLFGLKTDKEVTALEVELTKMAVAAAARLIPRLEKAGEYFRIPIMCNGMSVFGGATADGKHYFGRDFMFPAAEVYQDTACMIIYNPAPRRFWNRVIRKPLPFVAVTAPGFVGCPTAMNVNGVGFGVDIAPAGNCNPMRPGMNSLLMGRYCIERGKDAEAAVNAINRAQRGVSWIYFVAGSTDGNDRAAVVEAGMTAGELDYLKYPQIDLRGLLPPRNELRNANRGVFVRWNDYEFDERFFDYNDGLFKRFGKQFVRQNFEGDKRINRNWKDKKVPKAYYFAPKRTGEPGVIIASNHFVTPEMRLCGMDPWTAEVAGEKRYNDIQWRYDELNKRVMAAYGEIDFDKAKELIDFLAPYPKKNRVYRYYPSMRDPKDPKKYVIDGSVSVCNLTDRVIESHFGYYGDEWVRITLDKYVGNR